MKKLILSAIICTSLLTGCGDNPSQCYTTVQAKYPKSRIISIPTSKYRYIVINDSGSVRYVETMNEFDTGISLDMEIK